MTRVFSGPINISLDGVAVIPDGYTSIHHGAFRGCANLTSITLSESITSIDTSAFEGCASLTSITFPKGITSIGSSAFRGCASLTSITFPKGITSIGMNAFKGCKNLTSITLPDGITSIGGQTFGGCASLTSITFPKGITSIGISAFSGCASLTSITFPEGITSIGSSAFSGCANLTSITLSESITSIDTSAFEGCASLTSITLPNGVTNIGDWAFEGCTNLTSITLPASIASISNFAFSRTSLSVIKVDSNDEETIARIAALLPEKLQKKVISRALWEEIQAIQKDTLDELIMRTGFSVLIGGEQVPIIGDDVLPPNLSGLTLDYCGLVTPAFNRIREEIVSEPWPSTTTDAYKERINFFGNLARRIYKKKEGIEVLNKTLAILRTFKHIEDTYLRDAVFEDEALRKVRDILNKIQANFVAYVKDNTEKESIKIKKDFNKNFKSLKSLLNEAYPLSWQSILMTLFVAATGIGLIVLAAHKHRTGTAFLFRPRYEPRYEAAIQYCHDVGRAFNTLC